MLSAREFVVRLSYLLSPAHFLGVRQGLEVCETRVLFLCLAARFELDGMNSYLSGFLVIFAGFLLFTIVIIISLCFGGEEKCDMLCLTFFPIIMFCLFDFREWGEGAPNNVALGSVFPGTAL